MKFPKLIKHPLISYNNEFVPKESEYFQFPPWELYRSIPVELEFTKSGFWKIFDDLKCQEGCFLENSVKSVWLINRKKMTTEQKRS